MAIPGFGPIGASSFVVAIRDGQAVKCGQVVSSWLGLAPHQYSTSGKPIHFGNPASVETVIIWAPCWFTALVQYWRMFKRRKNQILSAVWVREVAKHHCQHKAILAIADKMARIGWAVLAKDLHYDSQLL